MSHITHADARKFWCDVYIAQITGPIPSPPNTEMTPFEAANEAIDEYASLFGDEQLLAEIEANKARREQGNMP